MSRGQVVQLLFVDEDASVWPRAEAFFHHQMELVGAHLAFHARRRLPERAAGFEMVSLDGRDLVCALLERGDLLADLRCTAIVNLHTNGPGATYAHLKRLLGPARRRAQSADGLWVFPQSWMAPWFQEPLEFPELGLMADLSPRHQTSPDRTWERRSAGPLMFMASPLVPARG